VSRGVAGRNAQDDARNHADQAIGEGDAGVDEEVVLARGAHRLHHADLPLLLHHQGRDHVDHQEAGHDQRHQGQEGHQVADQAGVGDQRVVLRILNLGEGRDVGCVVGDQVQNVVGLVLDHVEVGEAHPEIGQAHQAGQVTRVRQGGDGGHFGRETVRIEHDPGDGPGLDRAGRAVLLRIARGAEDAHVERVAHAQIVFFGHALLDGELVLAGGGPLAAF